MLAVASFMEPLKTFLDFHIFFGFQLGVNIGASTYRYVGYNYGLGNLGTLYTVGTLAKTNGKENWFTIHCQNLFVSNGLLLYVHLR